MTQFVTALELATYFNGTTDLEDLEPEWIAQANLLLEMISADIESAAGIPIEAGTGTVVLAGSWDRDLELPSGPIRDITAVTVAGLALAASEFFYNDRTILRRGSLAADEGFLDDSALVADWSTLGRQGATWRAGRHWGGPGSTVIVNYSWGFADVPAIVRALLFRIAARTFGNVSNVTQESLAIYSVTYGGNRAGGADDSGSHVTVAERRRLRHIFNRTGGTIHAGGR